MTPTNIYQSKTWNDIMKKTWVVKTIHHISTWGCEASLQERTIWLGMTGLFCLGWPTFSWSNQNISEFEQGIRECMKSCGAIFAQFEPVESDTELGKSWTYMKRFITQHTALIDLSKSEDELLAGMKGKGRYNIRVADRHGVTVRQIKSHDKLKWQAAWKYFYTLLNQTTDRNNFAQNNAYYYETLITELEKAKKGWLFVAEREGEVMAMTIMTWHDNVMTYYYGASPSDNALRKFMWAYAIQWHCMREWKKKWCHTYDFLWVSDPTTPNDSLKHVTDFKMKFWPEVVELPSARIMIGNTLKWWGHKGVRLIRR